jgi:membrane protease YdiL (CAAX protease family)
MKKRFPHTLLQTVFLFALGSIFGIPILFISDFVHKSYTNNEVVILGFGAAICASVILIALIKNKRNGLPVAFNGYLNINLGLILLWGTIISFQLINAPLINLITQYFSPNHPNVVNHGIVFFIGAILLGPILEELVFRGTILNGMLENYTPRKAILLSAIIFGLVHGRPIQIVPAFFWGLLFGYTFYKTRSIILVILLHITVNFTGLLSSLVHLANQPYTFLTAYGSYSWLVYSIAAVGLATGCYLLVKRQMFTKYLAEYQPDANNTI